MLQRDDILNGCREQTIEHAEVPEWSTNGSTSATVGVRILNALEASKMRGMIERLEAKGMASLAPLMAWCILSICDDDGAPVFAEADAEALAAGPYMPLQRCGLLAMELNGAGTAGQEDLEKNLETIPSGA